MHIVCPSMFTSGSFRQRLEFAIVAKFQTDPLEKQFSQYRQMNGGHFLVSFQEVFHSENVLFCCSLLKERINFWNKDLSINTNSTKENFIQVLVSQECNAKTLLGQLSVFM